jgi:hypothetical protein
MDGDDKLLIKSNFEDYNEDDEFYYWFEEKDVDKVIEKFLNGKEI